MADAVIEGKPGLRLRRGEQRLKKLQKKSSRRINFLKKKVNNSEIRRNKIMAIQQKMVKELREMTGAGMMDCKKALT